MKAEFQILEHPSDLGIEVRGSTLEDAFSGAAAGLMSIILDLGSVGSKMEKEVNINAEDIEQLLVKWLSEILYLYDGQHFVCSEFDIRQLKNDYLNAIVRGEEFCEKKHHPRLDVKAITYHQLLVKKDDKNAIIRVFVDI